MDQGTLDFFFLYVFDQAHVADLKVFEIPQTDRSCGRNTREYCQVPAYGGLSGHHVLETRIGFSRTARPGTYDVLYATVTTDFVCRRPGSKFTTLFIVSQLAWSISFAGLRGH
jgi:hypothetical protein